MEDGERVRACDGILVVFWGLVLELLSRGSSNVRSSSGSAGLVVDAFVGLDGGSSGVESWTSTLVVRRRDGTSSPMVFCVVMSCEPEDVGTSPTDARLPRRRCEVGVAW